MPKLVHAALLAVLLAALAGCEPTGPTSAPGTGVPSTAASSTGAAPSGPPASAGGRPPAEVYAEIRAAVSAIRGLAPTADVEPVTIDEAQLLANLEAEFDRERTPAQLAVTEELLATLGLLPKDASLRQLTLDFQAGQVAGYYSPDQDELFVVTRSGERVGAVERATYAHEFTHQLQDQHVDLEALGISIPDQSDRALARLALVEGDATSVQSAWMTENLSPQELGELFGAALDPKALEALRNAPAYLRETALFPYQDGLGFVTQILLGGGGYEAVDAAYRDPPDSTEQVLHPEKYLQREPPMEVALPEGAGSLLGAGWAEAARDTMGELLLRVWLTEGGVPLVEARAAAAGWGGDRLAFFRGPDGAVALLLVTRWDALGEAAEFAAAAETAVDGHGVQGRVVFDERAPDVYIGLGSGAESVLPRSFGN